MSYSGPNIQSFYKWIKIMCISLNPIDYSFNNFKTFETFYCTNA